MKKALASCVTVGRASCKFFALALVKLFSFLPSSSFLFLVFFSLLLLSLSRSLARSLDPTLQANDAEVRGNRLVAWRLAAELVGSAASKWRHECKAHGVGSPGELEALQNILGMMRQLQLCARQVCVSLLHRVLQSNPRFLKKTALNCVFFPPPPLPSFFFFVCLFVFRFSFSPLCCALGGQDSFRVLHDTMSRDAAAALLAGMESGAYVLCTVPCEPFAFDLHVLTPKGKVSVYRLKQSPTGHESVTMDGKAFGPDVVLLEQVQKRRKPNQTHTQKGGKKQVAMS